MFFVLIVIIPEPLYAASFLDGAAMYVINNILAILGNTFLTMTAQLVTVSGIFLSIAINITTHIGDFFDSVPALKEVWLVVRNISSIFIIFILLYSSINIIIGQGSDSQAKELIGKIIIAGLLINFSLFFAKVLIDGSNLVSLQFYRAIAPQSAGGLGNVSNSFKDGGLSDVFMSSLKLPQIYNNKAFLKSADIFANISIATVGGAIMMITAAISFLAVAMAIMARTAILIFVMSLSPLYFAAMIFPQLKSKADDLRDLFVGQLIFMPTYLFLMYVALKLISSPGFSSIFNQSATGIAPPGEGPFGPTFIGVIIQYVIALLFINAPLIMAIKMGAVGAKWGQGFNEAIYKNFGSAIGRNTAGRVGASLGSRFDNMAAKASGSENRIIRGTSSVLRNIGISKTVRGGLENMEKNKYGAQSIGDVEKENKERTRVIADVQRSRARREAIDAVSRIDGNTNPAQVETIMNTYKDVVSRMNSKELEKVKFNELTDSNFITHLTSSQADKLLEGDSMTEQQKTRFREIRKRELERVLSTSSTRSVVERIVKNLSGKEISKLRPIVYNNDNVLDYLAPSQLKEMLDIDTPSKIRIGNYIRNLALIPGNPHKSIGYIRNNDAEWS